MPFPATALLTLALLGPVSEEDRVTAARAAFDADNFATAVRGFESLAHDYPANARYHYYAGLARENAGQDTHAYVHMQVFLASGAGTEQEKKLARSRAAAIARRTTRTRIQLPVDDLPANLRITYRGPKPPTTRPPIIVTLAALPLVDTRPELALEPGTWELAVEPDVVGDRQIQPTAVEITAGEPTRAVRLETTPAPRLPVRFDLQTDARVPRKVTLELRREGTTTAPIVHTTSEATLHLTLLPGKWTYTASAHGLHPQQGTLVIGNRPAQQTVQFIPRIDPDRRRKLGLGLGLASFGILTAVPGAVLLPVANNTLASETPDRGRSLAGTGMGFMGATTGLWISAVSSISDSHRLWLAELILGSLVTGAGGIWFATMYPDAPRNYADEEWRPRSLHDVSAHVLASTYVLGLGAGLLGGAALGFATTPKKRPHTRASLTLSPHSMGPSVSLSLTF